MVSTGSTADVADSQRSVIVEQVTNGVAVRMAVFYLLLSGAGRFSVDAAIVERRRAARNTTGSAATSEAERARV